MGSTVGGNGDSPGKHQGQGALTFRSEGKMQRTEETK